MMTTKKHTLWMTGIIAGLILLLSAPAYAEILATLPKPQTDADGMQYITGGFGKYEREYLEAKAGNYNLKIVHATLNGKYTAGAEVVIKDSSGNQVFSSTDTPHGCLWTFSEADIPLRPGMKAPRNGARFMWGAACHGSCSIGRIWKDMMKPITKHHSTEWKEDSCERK
jgi:hypothetical protein